MTELQFDDIDIINAAATGDYGDFGPVIAVTQEMINQFADITRDHQWIHVDEEQAAASPFGGTIAHGFLSLSLLPHLVHGQIPIVGHKHVVNYGADSLRFITPVRAGQSVHAKSRLLKALKKDSGTLIKTSVALHVVNNEKPSILYHMLTLYQG